MKNTVEKGDKFEERVFNCMKKMLDEGRLPWANPSSSAIFRQKGYFSRDRGNDIKIDVSIEVYPYTGSQEIALLNLIECKDYQSTVPVGKIEEFCGKVRQIGGFKCKAIFVTSSNFQEGAERFAKSNGIALVRLFHEDQINWVNYEGTPDMHEEAARSMGRSSILGFIFKQSEIKIIPPNIESISYYNGKYYRSMEQLFQKI